MENVEIDWEKLKIKLNKAFQGAYEKLARVLFYLGEEQKAYEGINKLGPHMKILMSFMEVEDLFRQYAERLADDTKRADLDERFKEVLGLIWDQMLDANKNKQIDDQDDQVITPRKSLRAKLGEISLEAGQGLIVALSVIACESHFPIMIKASMGRVVNPVSVIGGVALAFTAMTYQAIINIIKWWNGDISGKRCCKNIIDSLAIIGGSVGGGFAGAAVGALQGPIGMIIGGIAGGIFGGELARILSQWMTEKIFGVPKSEALENAYGFFNLPNNASNHQINTAYRNKCLEYHPGKGGSFEMFQKVQIEMEVIKAAKGQLYS